MALAGASGARGQTHTRAVPTPEAAVAPTRDLAAPRGTRGVPRAGTQIPPRSPSGLGHCRPGEGMGRENAVGRQGAGEHGAQRGRAAGPLSAAAAGQWPLSL